MTMLLLVSYEARTRYLNCVSVSDTNTRMILVEYVSVKCLIQKIFVGFFYNYSTVLTEFKK